MCHSIGQLSESRWPYGRPNLRPAWFLNFFKKNHPEERSTGAFQKKEKKYWGFGLGQTRNIRHAHIDGPRGTPRRHPTRAARHRGDPSCPSCKLTPWPRRSLNPGCSACCFSPNPAAIHPIQQAGPVGCRLPIHGAPPRRKPRAAHRPASAKQRQGRAMLKYPGSVPPSQPSAA